ncbi:MAG TPA: hypothetical protein PLV01_06465 [Candidatus Kapabacteria bacterium]|nr:hypothetical protein [Candidatus Kapabacteria bacterium]
MAKEKQITIADLQFDDKNANRHTQKGLRLLEKSLQQLGAGRSIVLDKNNRIICGNGVVEVAGQIGLEKVRVVETTGDEIVAVKRVDLSLDDAKARELAIADNQTAKVGIEFDFDVLDDLSKEFNFDFAGKWELPDLSNFDDLPNLPEELQDIDILPNTLDRIEGDDVTLKKRIIITYPPEKEDEIKRLLGLKKITKVLYRLEEILEA